MQNTVEENKSIIEKSLFKSNKEEKKRNFTQAGYYSFIHGRFLDSN